jgi:hypothetical protein
VVSAGTKAMMSRATCNAARKGINGITKSLILHFATPHATKSETPSGGVHCPIARAMVTIKPNCKSGMLIADAMGKKTGTRISIAGVKSRKVLFWILFIR